MKKLIITEEQFKKLKENLIKETTFSWDGTYANEDVNEIMMGDDLETPLEEEGECGCSLNQPEPTDVQDSQWFSDVDGERLMDNQVD